AHLAAPDEASALAAARQLLSYLPSNNLEHAPSREPDDPAERMDSALDSIVPDQPQAPYDMHQVIRGVIDRDSWLELQPGGAANIIVGFARLGGRSVGIVAQQPSVLAGALDIDASVK